MYKTVWFINDGESKVTFYYYHLGKEPKFPTWYLQEEKVYEIEMVWNMKLVFTPKIFFKCLFNKYVIH